MLTGSLPIQRKLLKIVIVTGVLFILLDIFNIVRFNLILNESPEQAVIYKRTNFFIPNLPLELRSGNGYKYYSKDLDFEIYWKRVRYRWNWYLDEVFLSGVTFLSSLFFLLISLIIKKIIEETKKG